MVNVTRKVTNDSSPMSEVEEPPAPLPTSFFNKKKALNNDSWGQVQRKWQNHKDVKDIKEI